MDRVDQLNELLREYCCVISMSIEYQNYRYDLALKMSTDESGADAVTVLFQDISALNLSAFGGGLTQFMDLVVARIDAGLDRVRYELRDVESDKISLCFLSFSMSAHKD
ncbi:MULTISPECIES: hypothetical protein [unclassified Pseudomonas]|uniref:hypothetical protein n=1 Tax=unclassified Pseudomonas TaxID=196821 RepID=UPI000A1D9AB2|nr:MULTISPECIES: hypothetical protein [unclassified Pseudomonas]